MKPMFPTTKKWMTPLSVVAVTSLAFPAAAGEAIQSDRAGHTVREDAPALTKSGAHNDDESKDKTEAQRQTDSQRQSTQGDARQQDAQRSSSAQNNATSSSADAKRQSNSQDAKQRTLTGKVVSLGEVFGTQQADSPFANRGPRALQTDDGQLYVLLSSSDRNASSNDRNASQKSSDWSSDDKTMAAGDKSQTGMDSDQNQAADTTGPAHPGRNDMTTIVVIEPVELSEVDAASSDRSAMQSNDRSDATLRSVQNDTDVRVTGRVMEQGGLQAIVVDQIERTQAAQKPEKREQQTLAE